MSKVGCRINKIVKRPDPWMVQQLAEFPVSNLDDSMNRMSAVNKEIRTVNGLRLYGPAFTVKVPEGDNLMFHKAMDMAEPGDIIVIAAGGYQNRSIFGELMANYCLKRDIGGLIVDGAIRDVDALKHIGIPVYASGVSPNGPYKNGPGEINTDISFGGQVIHPGDIVIGDEDGIVVIQPEDAEAILEAVRDIGKKEAVIMDKILKETSYLRPWVDEKLSAMMNE